jgi:hypothetical protein
MSFFRYHFLDENQMDTLTRAWQIKALALGAERPYSSPDLTTNHLSLNKYKVSL